MYKESAHSTSEEAVLFEPGNSSVEENRYPHSLVWTPIPVLTWIFPLIGHIGITNYIGIIYDFAAPYTIYEDNMAFGWPTMVCRLDGLGREAWDNAVYEANDVYRQRVHNLFCDNCHSHVSRALNTVSYRGSARWNMFTVALLMFTKGRYRSLRHFLISWLPFLCLVTLILGIYFVVTRLSP